MRHRNILLSMLFAAGLVLNGTAHAVVLPAVDHGWYDDSGDHSPSNDNYLVGEGGAELEFYHDWFVFDLSSISGPVTGATLRAYNVDTSVAPEDGYQSPDPSETWTLYDVSTSIADLVGGTGGLSAYNDLASGTTYGSTVVTAADVATYVEATLNSDALADMNLASGQFAIGGALTTLGSAGQEAVFWYSHRDPSVELVVNTQQVPAPAPAALLATGLLIAGLASRFRARTA